MTENSTLLTTRQFSSLTGLSVSTITRLLREDKIQGAKTSGKWMIPENQVQSAAVQKIRVNPPGGLPNKTQTPEPAESTRAGKTYRVSEFAAMTYLRESGVIQWLKNGRLKGRNG